MPMSSQCFTIFSLVFILVAFLFQLIRSDSSTYSQNVFTCQGTTYNSAISKCPDIGTQRMSAGGNVTVFVRNSNNLPSSNKATGLSDPYVRFTIGTIVKQTRYVKNTLNPVWNQYVNLGVLGSATLINVELMSKGGGLLFADALLATSSVRVPFCSTFYANYSYNNCGADFGCESDDSLWHMPSRQQCVESGYVSFVNGKFCSSGICLYLDFIITPFTMAIERTFKNNLVKTPVLTAVGKSNRPYHSNHLIDRLFNFFSRCTSDRGSVDKNLRVSILKPAGYYRGEQCFRYGESEGRADVANLQ